MQPFLSHPAQEVELRSKGGGLYRLRWDDLRLLLYTTECGSFRAAAELLGCSMNTVRNRIDRLERITGDILLTRSITGVEPTVEGVALVRIAERMRQASLEAEAFFRRSGAAVTGEVRLSVTEGLGTFWLVPRLVEFHRKNPGLTIDLQCDMQQPDLMRHEVDLAIMLDRPGEPDLLVQKIGYIHTMPFASEEYLRLMGTPRKFDDMVQHHFVEQRAAQVPSDLLYQLVDSAETPGFVSFRTNTSSAHYWAIAKGAGIGVLPTYIRAISKKVLPIDLGFHLRRKIWLAYHPSVKSSRKVQLVLDWLRDAFDPTAYPWFGERFIHPNELERYLSKSTVINLFEGFVENEPAAAGP